MKVKLDKRRGFSIFEVAEGISTADLESLQMALEKTVKATKEPVILSLLGAKPELDAYPALLDFQLFAFKLGMDLIVVSLDPRLRQFGTLQEATQLLISGTSLIGLRHSILTRLLQGLEEKRQKLTIERDTLCERHVNQENLPIENERLRVTVATLSKMARDTFSNLKACKEDFPDKQLIEIEERVIKFVKEQSFHVSDGLKNRRPT